MEQNRQISRLLSAKPHETAEAVLEMSNDVNTKRTRIYQLEEELFAMKASEAAGIGDVVIFFEGLASDSVRRACDAVQQTCGGTACVFSGNDEEGYKYALGCPDGDLRGLVKELNAALSGRGGGKPGFVQGSVKATRKEIEAFIDEHLTGDR